MSNLDEMFDAAAEERLWQDLYERNTIHIKVWNALWPGHCQTCNGWGGATIPGTRWEPDDFEPCSRNINAPTVCCRCGYEGLSEDGDGPCCWCGWNYDDGSPQM